MEYTIDSSWWFTQQVLTGDGPQSYKLPEDYPADYMEKNYIRCIVQFSMQHICEKDRIAFVRLVAKHIEYSPVRLLQFVKEQTSFTVTRSEYESLQQLGNPDVEQGFTIIRYEM